MTPIIDNQNNVTTPILLNNFQAQWNMLRDVTLKAIDRVGKSGWYILGDEGKAFENDLAHYCQFPYAVGCASGLDALEIALRCSGLKAGDKVLTTPLSAFATTLAIVKIGGIPIFVDVDDSGLVDLQLCQHILEQHSDIRYFVPVHLFGHALSYPQLMQLKSQFHLKIIEDGAQAIGAKNTDKMIGSAADIISTSFYPTKNLGCMGDGGAVLMRDNEKYHLAKSLRDYGQTAKYEHSYLGMNSRLDEIQAAILRSVFLPHLPEFTRRRQYIAQYYLNNIHNPYIKIPSAPQGSESVWHLFPILIKQNRCGLQKHLQQFGIQSAVHYPFLITEQSALLDQAIPFTIATPLTKAKYFVDHELSLPIHPFLLDNDIERVVSACNSWQGD